jgi:hypothetical protein
MNSEIHQSTRTAIFEYARKLRTVAFNMERWTAPSEWQFSEGDLYQHQRRNRARLNQLDDLVSSGQQLEEVFANDIGYEESLPTHDSSSLANLPFPKALYLASESLTAIAKGNHPDSEMWRFSQVISGVRNVAEDVAGALGLELETPFRGAESTALGL